MSTPPLDKRIATALGESDHDPNDLAALIKEITDTIGSVTAERTFSSKAMIDPMNVDYAASKERVDKADLMLTRLNTALPRLQKIHDDLVTADKLAKWNADFAALKLKRDELAQKFRETYCRVGEELIGIFDEMAVVDKEIDYINDCAYSSGAAAMPRMRTTEACARGVDYINAGTKSLLETVRLPLFGLGSGNPDLAWPRPRPNFGLAVAAAMGVPSSAPPPTDAERIARSQQLAEQGRERERQKEANAAIEAQRQREAAVERRRQGA